MYVLNKNNFETTVSFQAFICMWNCSHLLDFADRRVFVNSLHLYTPQPYAFEPRRKRSLDVENQPNSREYVFDGSEGDLPDEATAKEVACTLSNL